MRQQDKRAHAERMSSSAAIRVAYWIVSVNVLLDVIEGVTESVAVTVTT